MNINENELPPGVAGVGKDEASRIIKELIVEFDAEIEKQRANAKIAYRGMILTLILCLLVFLVPNFYGNSYERARKNTFPIQDSINSLVDSQKVYKLKIDVCQKRFNDIRVIQNKFGKGLDSLYFQIYADDGIFSNLLYRPSKGQYDTAFTGRPLAFGGEIPFTINHDPLNNAVVFVKLHIRDTMQDRNFDLFKNGILTKQKALSDSIISLKNHKEQNIVNNRNSFEIVDALSVRLGAFLILVFMVYVLVFIQRYYNRLAQYYISRRNALKLHLLNDDKLSFEHTVNLLSPDHIELKMPQYFGNKGGS